MKKEFTVDILLTASTHHHVSDEENKFSQITKQQPNQINLAFRLMLFVAVGLFSRSTTAFSPLWNLNPIFIPRSRPLKKEELRKIVLSTRESTVANCVRMSRSSRIIFSAMEETTKDQPLIIIEQDKQKSTESAKETLKQPLSSPHAKIVPNSPSSLGSCATRIASGHLVAFPTETVYGLGANGLDPSAVEKIYQAKRRPKTDPLILHVLGAQDAMPLWNTTSDPRVTKALQCLTETFFPGPLTLVAKANSSIVPSIVTANTGYVAVRSPSHAVARQLIGLAKLPIAAPSANRYGHVSPTKSSHVMHDLSDEDVWIVDSSDDLSCSVGVESTVAKVQTDTITILRQGAVSLQNIQSCIEKHGLLGFRVNAKVTATQDNVTNVSPGQTIRHYAPNVQSFMISKIRFRQWRNAECLDLNEEEEQVLKGSVVIDFGGKLHCLKHKSFAYKDLSPSADPNEAALHVFDTLRWAEKVEGAKRVFFPEVVDNGDDVDALILALKDRLTRAASGVVVQVLV